MKKFVIKKVWLLDEHRNKIAELTLHNPDEVFKDVVDKERITGGVGKKIRILNTENTQYFTIDKEYVVIGERDTSDDGYECEILIVIDDEGDEFHICNQQEATYEIVK